MGALGDLRARVAGALDGLAPDGDDWPVFDAPVDAVSPPCYVLVWSEPWLTWSTVCIWTARLDVIVVGARIDPAPGYEQLEALLEAAVGALALVNITAGTVAPPGPLEVAGITYQAARMHLSAPVTLEE